MTAVTFLHFYRETAIRLTQAKLSLAATATDGRPSGYGRNTLAPAEGLSAAALSQAADFWQAEVDTLSASIRRMEPQMHALLAGIPSFPGRIAVYSYFGCGMSLPETAAACDRSERQTWRLLREAVKAEAPVACGA